MVGLSRSGLIVSFRRDVWYTSTFAVLMGWLRCPHHIVIVLVIFLQNFGRSLCLLSSATVVLSRLLPTLNLLNPV